MSKVLVVARNEYFIAITSKAFLIGIILMPILMGGAFGMQFLTRDQVALTERKIAIVVYCLSRVSSSMRNIATLLPAQKGLFLGERL